MEAAEGRGDISYSISNAPGLNCSSRTFWLYQCWEQFERRISLHPLKKTIDFSDPYKAFPFLSPDFEKGGYLIVDDEYHDTLFPYSELKNEFQEQLTKDVANGITKVYVGKQWKPHYKKGEPIFIYCRYRGTGQPRYKSCVTSYCVVEDIIAVKRNNLALVDFDTNKAIIGNRVIGSR